MSLTASELRAEAARARRLMKGVGDPWTADSLAAYADECEQRADELEERPGGEDKTARSAF